jgi:integrase
VILDIFGQEVIERIPKNGKYVFINTKTGMKHDYRKGLLKGLCKHAKVRNFTFHALPHYEASRHAKECVPLTDIQALLGHQRASSTDH